MSNIKVIRKKLLLRRQEILETFSDNKLRVPDDYVKDAGDQAFALIQEDLEISLYNNELEEYYRINKAIEMIDQGTYGICIECEESISEKRLAVYPNTTRCLPCQEASEVGRL